MWSLSLVFTGVAFVAACYVWADAGRLRRRLEDDLSLLTDLDCTFADREVEIDGVIRRVADHFRRGTVGELTPDTPVKDAVVACPALREVFLARRGDKPRMVWDVSIREFAVHFAQDLDELMETIRTTQQAGA